MVHDTATGRPLVTMEQPLTGEAVSAASACVAFSPDGRRVAALLAGRAAGPAAVKVWDAASGKELLALRPASAGGWEAKRLTFTGDGHRLVFVEFEPDPDTAFGGLRSRGVTRPLLLTTWDATPVAGREPGQP